MTQTTEEIKQPAEKVEPAKQAGQSFWGGLRSGIGGFISALGSVTRKSAPKGQSRPKEGAAGLGGVFAGNRQQETPWNPKDPRPVPPKPRFKIPPTGFLFTYTRQVARLLVKGALVVTALTGFAKKETQPAVTNEAPKAVVSAGVLGMTLVKASVNNGNKSTDFEANGIFAKTAAEVADKLAPGQTTDRFYEDNPIENGAYGEGTKKFLEDKAAQAAALAKRYGRGGGR